MSAGQTLRHLADQLDLLTLEVDTDAAAQLRTIAMQLDELRTRLAHVARRTGIIELADRADEPQEVPA